MLGSGGLLGACCHSELHNCELATSTGGKLYFRGPRHFSFTLANSTRAGLIGDRVAHHLHLRHITRAAMAVVGNNILVFQSRGPGIFSPG